MYLRASARARAVQFVLSKQATQFVLAVIWRTTKPAETVQVQWQCNFVYRHYSVRILM